MNNNYLIKNIEVLREKLYSYLIYLEPTDNKVVYLSQQLDKLLVLYESYKNLESVSLS
ncbi:aspartyl-phosphate phosphatase Spo0E family protein [Clostridium sp. 19966]|uniref:aspartyl-phosphate phosphatase Spo0E family protein n=1 Tax=Clostridium sp. 19966 TaxID=2768166 RepID=UPI0028DE20FD|nr:aspartyl-phosphate phosphatase Spo0E family protein [Clostridium sp. 19966]MDT8715220.1 aspartyl-phosphate phosphatase Spo0E family protein [Clostridium sp. 19966]